MFGENNGSKIHSCNDVDPAPQRYLNPADIYIVKGYGIEVFLENLNSPAGIVFDEEGSLYIADSGLSTGNPQVLKLVNGEMELIAENFVIPISGINYLNGVLYVSHRGFVTCIFKDGTRQNIIMGLPSNGDHYNGPVAFSPDYKIYFGQGTVTNSGVVGNDNEWVPVSPLLCDYTGDYVMLSGQNFATDNILTEALTDDLAFTGAFSPYGIPNIEFEIRKRHVKASGSIIRANLDGSNLEQVAWGFRNPLFLKFNNSGQLYAINNGFNPVGSRPIENATDDFYYITPDLWYGWPDYSAGEPVNSPRFTPTGGYQPTLIFKNPPSIPPRPYVSFPPNSTLMSFDFNYNQRFGPYGDVYMAEYGSTITAKMGDGLSYAGSGHRISKIDMRARTISTFAINKSGFPASISKGGGLERPSHLVFGPNESLYIVDMGLNVDRDPNIFIPGTGVVWRVFRTND
ncbi:PQQ-dependent sugar dehydrogenase [Lacrimispora sp. 38-1]|uniref:PQQ-dependent sugar dehydrogenase n=1 Tax=Lacrimispora sp. 38-1 TaxID=3125778 RepID=UPI003CE70DD0